HEYSHLLLHTSGLCDAKTDTEATTPNRRLEARCNAIAAAILMPAESVLTQAEVSVRGGSPDSWDYQSLRSSASLFGVSAEAFLRRLVTLGRVPGPLYERRREEFLAT
ncbi:MAG: ImmA/IrrE family metallo-endopeptidase, partial [Mycobacteriales bacterium]